MQDRNNNIQSPHFDETKKTVLNNYNDAAVIAFSPLVLSVGLIRAKHEGGGLDFTPIFRLLGWVSLPCTLVASVISVPAGFCYAVANSVYGAVALPVAIIKDKNIKPLPVIQKHATEIELKSQGVTHASTRQIQQDLNLPTHLNSSSEKIETETVALPQVIASEAPRESAPIPVSPSFML